MLTETQNAVNWKTAYKQMLRRTGACSPAVEYFLESKAETFADFWNGIERSEWMLWLAAKLDMDRKLIVMAGCRCARTALRFVKPGEDRPRLAIETAERWCRGEVTIKEVRSAASAASAADAADAADAASAVARAKAQKEMCGIIRETFTAELVWKAIEGKLI